VRVAIITESFAPDLNGVANSVVKVVEQLARRGHEPMVIAPQPSPTAGRPIARKNSSRFHEHDHGYPVVRVRSVPVPGYRSFRVGFAEREGP
jgi:phosphatidylinositol alpha 1,6-mannosyltransferase